MFNPFKYKYQAKKIADDGADAILQIQNGQIYQDVRMPRALLPQEIQPGQSFTISFQAEETAKTGEYESLKRLLQELIQ